MIARLIAAVTRQIIDNLLLPPVALGFELADALSDDQEKAP
jgi:hypothetical protein